MFQNLFGSVSRFLQRLAPQQQPQRGTTPQGQAKLDTFTANKGNKAPTPAGQAKLDAQSKQPFGKPVAYDKGFAPQKGFAQKGFVKG